MGVVSEASSTSSMFTADNDSSGHGCAPVLPSGEWNQYSSCVMPSLERFCTDAAMFFAYVNITSKYRHIMHIYAN